MKYFLLLIVMLSGSATVMAEEDPAEIAIGERIFLETRFARHNAVAPGQADPAVDRTSDSEGRELGNPFRGNTMSCRACHLVDELAEVPGAGMRTYADFARRSPVPRHERDNQARTVRNSMSLVNISIPGKKNVVFHHDGQFNSLEDLVRGTFTGRNLGWRADENARAVKHIATVVREDDGQDELGQEFGGSYRKLLSGKDGKLPEEYRLDIDKASDRQILDALARLVSAYVRDLGLSRDEQGRYDGSPYDAFLAANNLPRKPAAGESDLAYSRRLLEAVKRLEKPVFIDDKERAFASHDQAFRFATEELAGMKVFFGEKTRAAATGKSGNCIACHSAPHFSDSRFHNTGVSQEEYDGVHGLGSFMKLAIPNQATRLARPDQYLPESVPHPQARSAFRAVPVKHDPQRTDLGVWNVYANPDMPEPQAKLSKLLCGQSQCDIDETLNIAIAAFKTPGIRDSGHSAPYFHNGAATSLEQVLGHYVSSSSLARDGKLRNAPAEMADIDIDAQAQQQLASFLRALNEDYD
ncbi:MAG: cytochrome c peroxidase [Granulosicoccaceae bacterium]|jgi:cytochrome c peroxidase